MKLPWGRERALQRMEETARARKAASGSRLRIVDSQDWDGNATAQLQDETGRWVGPIFGTPFPRLQARIWALVRGHGWI